MQEKTYAEGRLEERQAILELMLGHRRALMDEALGELEKGELLIARIAEACGEYSLMLEEAIACRT